MFENDSFVNKISAAQEYYHPINTQDIVPSKRQIFPFSSSSNNKQSSSSNNKKKKQIENCQKGGARVQRFRKNEFQQNKNQRS